MDKDKFFELDKAVSKEIMPLFRGKVIESKCYVCLGLKKIHGEDCPECNATGTISIQY